jgi:hypothetical protein
MEEMQYAEQVALASDAARDACQCGGCAHCRADLYAAAPANWQDAWPYESLPF